MTARAEIVTEIYADLGFRGALEGLREATAISELQSENLFEFLVEDRRSDSESLDETRNKVAELLGLVDVDPDTQQATINREDAQEFFSERGLAYFWLSQNASRKVDSAEKSVEQILSSLTEDKLVQWSIVRHLHRPVHITNPPAKTLQTVNALDRVDTTLREHAGETLTFINSVGIIDATTNDGDGLRAHPSRYGSVIISAAPTYTANTIDYLYRTPGLLSSETCRIDFTDAIKLGTPENCWDNWSASLRSPTWLRSTPLLLFGNPVEGPLYVDAPYRGNNPEIDDVDMRYYEHAISRARLVAELSIGAMNHDEAMRQGFVISQW